MNILITGINGYIGSKLSQLLVSNGHTVNGLVRKNNTISERLDVEVFEADIRHPILLHLQKQYDFIIHLASANDIDSANPKEAYEVTTLGTKNCLEFSLKNNIKNFIYLSTFQVYGELDKDFSETSPKNPLNEYGITHLFAEQYVEMYSRKHTINYLILRPTNIFGAPRFKEIDRWSLVPGCFCKEVFKSNIITLQSSGIQLRDFIDLGDLNLSILKAILNFKDYANTDINVSSGNIYSIIEIAKEVQKQFENNYHKAASIVIKSKLPLTTTSFKINRTRISELNNNFKDKSSLTEAINNTFDILVN
jgi:UDP-glucose 4-epimerase